MAMKDDLQDGAKPLIGLRIEQIVARQHRTATRARTKAIANPPTTSPENSLASC